MSELEAVPDPPLAIPASLVDWRTFFDADHNDADFLVEPLLARGRGHSIFAPAKGGKSLLALELAAALAAGRPVLRQPGGAPVKVLYLDYEMTEADLHERVLAFGYGPDDVEMFSDNLAYALLPSMPPLDTHIGGDELMHFVDTFSIEVVIIDTLSRAIAGAENDADTIRGFYACTGIKLKQAGVTWLRLDHAGKDPTKAQRGSSAKADDVDVIWHLKERQDGLVMTSTSRVSWIPRSVELTRLEEPTLRHDLGAKTWLRGTKETAELLDRYAVPVEASVRMAAQTLRDHGDGRRLEVVMDAQKWRRLEAEEAPR